MVEMTILDCEEKQSQKANHARITTSPTSYKRRQKSTE